MRGLYLGSDVSELVSCSGLVDAFSKTLAFEGGKVIYNKFEWTSPPVHVIEGRTLIVAGWFVYKDRRNDIASLARELHCDGLKTLKFISAGSFIAYWKGDEDMVFVDPMGMSNHYIDRKQGHLRIAPSVKSLLVDGVHEEIPLMQCIMDKIGHLFGVYTVYSGITRLEPGSVVYADKTDSYLDLTDNNANFNMSVVEKFSTLASHWSKEERLLPISGGLDSRLILASSSFDNGFTYGPESSSEMQIAKKFSSEFKFHYTFDFEENAETECDVIESADMAFGTLVPNRQLLANYKHVKGVFPASNAFFDGYLGEVFQRGTYITFKGVLGEIFKMFPFLYRLPVSELWLLRKRYRKLTKEEFEVLKDDYCARTSGLKLKPYQRITYYEALYGRGARYILFGSNVLAAQIFTNVSPFADVRVFSELINSNFLEAVSFKRLRYFWADVKEEYRKVPVESGYTPNTPYLLIGLIQFYYRTLFHLIPSRGNYGITMKRRKKSVVDDV